MRSAAAVACVASLLVAPVAAGCGAASETTAATTAPPRAVSTAADAALAGGDRASCELLLARLRRVTVALATSAELIAHSLNRKQLARRIGIEQVQLERSARLIATGPVPPSLAATRRDLVAALRALARDYARARPRAAAGDFGAAAAAMNDPPLVARILRASKRIERACG